MSSTDEQRTEASADAEDLALDDQQTEDVKGGAVEEFLDPKSATPPPKHGAPKKAIDIESFS